MQAEESDVALVKAVVAGLDHGQHKTPCPFCQHTRTKHRHDRPLSVSVTAEHVRWTCWHCGIAGGYDTGLGAERKRSNMTGNMNASHRPNLQSVKPAITPPRGASAETIEKVEKWLEERGIPLEVAQQYTLIGEWRFNGEPRAAIGFPYRQNGHIVSIKWRSADNMKLFSQQGVCDQLWNIENFAEGKPLLITEGEMDALAWLAAGVDANIVSVPNGAPKEVKEGVMDARDDKRFAYAWAARDVLTKTKQVIINSDTDGPGQALAEELSRRIGKAKCWTVDTQTKDANEALVKHGPDHLRDSLSARCHPMPMLGLYAADHYSAQFQDLYDNGRTRGADTGFPDLDQYFSVCPGMLTVVTGWPGDGKSELVDQLVVNLAKNHDWKTVFCSFEKPVDLHMAQLAQKVTAKPFFDGPTPRMTKAEAHEAELWMREHFLWMDYMAGGPADIEGILTFAAAAVMRMGVRVLVIDPYNFIEVDYRAKMETDAISEMLTKVQQFAKQHSVHVFFVAHPAKPAPADRTRRSVPTGLDVAKSMAWFAKADFGITMFRDPETDTPEVHCWKVRWSWMGKRGVARLSYDPVTGRYHDPKADDSYSWDDAAAFLAAAPVVNNPVEGP